MKNDKGAGIPQFLKYLVKPGIPDEEFVYAPGEDEGVMPGWQRDVPLNLSAVGRQKALKNLREENDYSARRIALLRMRNEQQRRKAAKAPDIREKLAKNEQLMRELKRSEALAKEENALNADYLSDKSRPD